MSGLFTKAFSQGSFLQSKTWNPLIIKDLRTLLSCRCDVCQPARLSVSLIFALTGGYLDNATLLMLHYLNSECTVLLVPAASTKGLLLTAVFKCGQTDLKFGTSSSVPAVFRCHRTLWPCGHCQDLGWILWSPILPLQPSVSEYQSGFTCICWPSWADRSRTATCWDFKR